MFEPLEPIILDYINAPNNNIRYALHTVNYVTTSYMTRCVKMLELSKRLETNVIKKVKQHL